jgi:hypothetical protein
MAARNYFSQPLDCHLTADLIGTKIKVEAYSIKTAKGPRLIVLQDFPTDGKSESPEAKSALKIICESFAVPK